MNYLALSFVSIICLSCGFSAWSCSFAGCHDPRHANLQSHDAIWLRPDTPACTEHQQYIYTGGTAEATTTAATATTGTAGKRRYNTEYWHFLPHPFPALRGEIKISSPQISCLLHMFWENKFNFSSISELYWKFIIEKKQLSLFFRPSWNVRADPSAFPFPDSNRLNHHSTAREYPALQHPADPHDPYYTSHTSLRELWNCTTATVCWKDGQSICLYHLYPLLFEIASLFTHRISGKLLSLLLLNTPIEKCMQGPNCAQDKFI